MISLRKSKSTMETVCLWIYWKVGVYTVSGRCVQNYLGEISDMSFYLGWYSPNEYPLFRTIIVVRIFYSTLKNDMSS